MNDEIKIEKDSGRDMTPKLIGETYLKKPKETSPKRYKYGVYECQYCGQEFEAITKDIKSGNTKSCGCLKGDAHGLSQNKFYQTWHSMLGRCNNSNHKNYKYYGARGITVCEEWLDVANFVAWAEKTHPNVKGVTLDRIDNDKGYSPDNCRWTDATTQCVNQGMKSSNTSGFVGVSWHKGNTKWVAQIMVNKIVIHLGSFKTKEEAVEARDNYIIENNLPHKLSTYFKKEN